jgi:hypothetical protein
MTPVEAVLATAEPEMVPVSPEANTATSPGPPTKAAGHRPGQVDDKVAGAGAQQKGAEEDEHEDEGGRDPGDVAENSIIAVDRTKQDGLGAQAAELEHPVDQTAPPPHIGQCHDDEDGDDPAGGTAGEFDGGKDQGDAGDPLTGVEPDPALVDGILHADQIQGGTGGQQPQTDIDR